MLEKRKTIFKYEVPNPNGRSYYVCECPFCHKRIEVYCWAKRKKCKCGAIVVTGFPEESYKESEEV